MRHTRKPFYTGADLFEAAENTGSSEGLRHFPILVLRVCAEFRALLGFVRRRANMSLGFASFPAIVRSAAGFVPRPESADCS